MPDLKAGRSTKAASFSKFQVASGDALRQDSTATALGQIQPTACFSMAYKLRMVFTYLNQKKDILPHVKIT